MASFLRSLMLIYSLKEKERELISLNYYYDILLNWNEVGYSFYEWDDTDVLELVKKIPFFKVRHKTLVDLITNKVKVEPDFLNLIKDKTLVSNRKFTTKLSYAALLTDNKNVIALEFNEEGLTINQSYLLIDDELNTLESTYGLKELLLNYEIIIPLFISKTLRQEQSAKSFIIFEINQLYQKGDLNKLKYLYYEYKQITSEDLELIYHTFLEDINKDFNVNLLKLYHIIKLSYHNV